MDLYYDTIARDLKSRQLDMIHHIPQPVMFGGKRTRNFVLAGNTDFSPSSLAVGYSGGSMLDAMYNEADDLQNESLNGSGIFGKKFDRGLKKLIGKKTVKGLYKVLDKEVKPLINKGLDMGVDVLGTAQPELIPALEIGKKMAKGYIDKPTAYQKNPSKMLIKDLNPVGLAKDYIRGEIESKLMPSAPAPNVGSGRTGRKRKAKKALDKTHYWDGEKWVLLPQAPRTKLESDTIIEGSGRKRGRPRKTTAKASDYLDTVISSLKSSSKIEPVKRGRGRPRKGGAMLSSQTEQLIQPSYPKSLMKVQGKFKGGASSGGKRSARAEIVKKVMSQKGLSMCDASKYVKQNNLY
jgi:hypothetical protein